MVVKLKFIYSVKRADLMIDVELIDLFMNDRMAYTRLISRGIQLRE